jgi:diguanylate cyclase
MTLDTLGDSNLLLQEKLHALELAQLEQDVVKLAQLHFEVSEVLFDLGQFSQALQVAEYALALIHPLEQPQVACAIQLRLGAVLVVLGQHQAAWQHLQQVLDVAGTHGWLELQTKALKGQSDLYSVLGNYNKAIELLLEALRLEEGTAPKATVLATKSALGCLYVEKNDSLGAVAVLTKLLPETRAFGQGRLLTNVLINLGFAYMNLGFDGADPAAWVKGTSALREALVLAAQEHDAQGEVICLTNLGEIATQQHQAADAIALLSAAREKNHQVGDPRQEVRIINALGEAHMALGAFGAGIDHLMEALSAANRLGEPPTQRQVLEVLAAAFEQIGDHQAALLHHKALRTLERSLTDQAIQFRTQALLIEHQAEQLRQEAALERQKRQQLELQNSTLETQNNLDPLTGAYNRRYLETALQFMEQDALFGVSVVMIDVDHFKRINDQFGHYIGDEVLKKVVWIAHHTIRKTDVLARYGGEEFTLLLPNTPLERAIEVAERVRHNIEGFMWRDLDTTLRVTVSLGVAFAEGQPQTALKHADQALYRAKTAGRNRVAFFGGGERP